MNKTQLKRAMEEAGLTDRDLAARSGVHITLVRRYLAGEVSIGAKNAKPIADALGVSVEAILYGLPKQPKRVAAA